MVLRNVRNPNCVHALPQIQFCGHSDMSNERLQHIADLLRGLQFAIFFQKSIQIFHVC